MTERKGKMSRWRRMLGACILMMTAALAVCTVAFADAVESGGSYSLVILKRFAFDDPLAAPAYPQEVRDQARDRQYTFRVTGSWRDRDGHVTPINETVTLPREVDGRKVWSSEKFQYNGPYTVTVTEITDNIEIVDNKGQIYNMSNSSSDTSLEVNSRVHEVQLRNNSVLTITRPAQSGSDPQTDPARPDAELLWYRLSNRPYEEHGTPVGYVSVDEVFSLRMGDQRSFPKLSAAIYTIEQIAAPDGYQLQMGTRTEQVGADVGVGHFHINGTPGTLLLTAGGTSGDGATHYYTIDRTEKDPEDPSAFTLRTVPIASGETYRLDDLPRGGYTVTEYTIGAREEFTARWTRTSVRQQSKKTNGLTKNTGASWRGIDLSYPGEDFDVDYIRMVRFGPLRNADGAKLNNKTSYKRFGYAAGADGDPKKVEDMRFFTKGFTGDKTTSVSKTEAFLVIHDNHKKLYFTVTGLVSSTARTLDVTWEEFDEREDPVTFLHAGVNESITVNEYKRLEITAPALQDPNAPGAQDIFYYYAVRDDKGNLVAAVGTDGSPIANATDRPDQTVRLRPGGSCSLLLPEAGSYTVQERIEGGAPVGFTMQISGYPFGTTTPHAPIEVEVGGARTVTVSKPALSGAPRGTSDAREYVFRVQNTDINFTRTMTVRAGESATLTLPQAGRYMITPLTDNLGSYQLNYKDSGAIYGTASGSTGEITFTNDFTAGAYGYRFVHEYYIREPDGTYSYVGNSPITTRLGREQNERYQALDISQAPEFEGNHYEHFSEAYGTADALPDRPSGRSETNRQAVRARRAASAPDTATPGEALLPAENGEPSPQGEAEPPAAAATPGEPALPPNGGEAPAAAPNTALSPAAGAAPEESVLFSSLRENTAPAREDAAPAPGDAAEPADGTGGADVSVGTSGIVDKGVGKDSHQTDPIGYAPDSGKDHIVTTTDASQIVILRYFRERHPKGMYNVIHVYYLRDEEGDHWEGTSGVIPTEGELGIRYIGKNVERQEAFRPDGAPEMYRYTWDGRPQYGVVDSADRTDGYDPDQAELAGGGKIYLPNNNWTAAEATAEGNQIIILRYYREPNKEGGYRVVHEYYLREPDADADGGADGSEGTGGAEDVGAAGEADVPTEDLSLLALDPEAQAGGAAALDEESETGIEVLAGGFAGTLLRDDGYRYTFEGNTEPEPFIAPLRSTHTAAEQDRRPEHDPPGDARDQTYTYAYLDAGYGTVYDDGGYSCDQNQQWAAATSDGDQLIILRYVRTAAPETDPPADPPDSPVSYRYRVVHEYYVRDSAGAQTLVGVSDIRTVADAEPDVPYTEEDVGREPMFAGESYTFFDWGYGTASGQSYSAQAGKRFVLATERGEEIIILRYIREAPGGVAVSAPETGDAGSSGRWAAAAACSLGGLAVLGAAGRGRKRRARAAHREAVNADQRR